MCACNNARRDTCGLSPPVKLESCHINLTVLARHNTIYVLMHYTFFYTSLLSFSFVFSHEKIHTDGVLFGGVLGLIQSGLVNKKENFTLILSLFLLVKMFLFIESTLINFYLLSCKVKHLFRRQFTTKSKITVLINYWEHFLHVYNCLLHIKSVIVRVNIYAP